LPAYPLFEIVHIEQIQHVVYRMLDSSSAATAHTKATGRLPERAQPVGPVVRKVPKAHWCAYEKWDTPEERTGVAPTCGRP
jgi:hypothetical protein